MLGHLLSVLLWCTAALALPYPTKVEVDSEESRRVLGSSVVTSVSVIMDLGNGTKKYFADAAGRPVPKPTAALMVGSPVGLLNPDRYEFYTFDEAGDLVKRLMTLEEIQSIIANGETEVGEAGFPNYYHQNLPLDSSEFSHVASSTIMDKVIEEAEATDIGELSSAIPGVHDVVMSVQNVLKGELEASKNKIPLPKPVSSPPAPTVVPSSDSSMSWGIILPGIMGNSGTVSSFANQSIFSPAGPVLNTSQELGDNATGIHVPVTKNVTWMSTHVLDNIAEASTSKITLTPASSNILDVEQTTSSAVNTHSNLQSLQSSPTLHISSSLPPSSHTSSSQVLSSSTPLSSTSAPSSSSTLSSQFTVPSSSPKPSPPLSLTSHTSVTPSPATLQGASIMALMSQSSETPASPQPSLLSSKPLSTPTQKPQVFPLNHSYFSTVETVTDPPLIIKDNLHINGNKPLNSYESYKPVTGETYTSAAAVSTMKPISTTHLHLSTFKIPSSAPSFVEPESQTSSTIPHITQSLLSLLTESFSTVPVNSERITSPQKFVATSTANPSHTQSLIVERTTKNPTTSATSTAASSSSDNTVKQHEYSESMEPAMIMITSSESSNHSSLSLVPEFLQVFTAAKNASSMTEKIQFSKPMQRPSTATEHSTIIKFSPSTPVSAATVVHTQPQTTTQTSVESRKPTKPTQTTLATRNITKSTMQPHSVSSSVQSSTVNPDVTTTLSLAVTNDKNKDIPTADLQKNNVLNTKLTTSSTTTTELPLQSDTSKNNSENILVNEVSGLAPMKIGSPVGAISLPVTAIGDLDMPPELAESVLGVLSQVADVEGAATTIAYGEDSLYSLSTTTEHSFTDNISSASSSSGTTAIENVIQSSTKPLDYENIMTESKNIIHHAPSTETLPATNLHSETDKQNAVTTQFFSKAPSSQEQTNFYLKESTDNDPTTQSFSLEDIDNDYLQQPAESTTVDAGEEHEKNGPVDVNKIEMRLGGIEDDEVAEESNKLVEEIVNLEGQKDVDKEAIKQKVVGNASVELLSSADKSSGGLKTSLGILKTEPHYEETATSEPEETDSYAVYNVIVTTEVTDDITTGSDGTRQKESTVSSVGESTTEQPHPDRNTVKNVVNEESSDILAVEESSAATQYEGQYVTETTITPESIMSRDTTESSIHTTKESSETSTITLTKYKKNDGETAEGSLQGNVTSKPSDKLDAVKINPDNISSITKNASDGDTQSVSTESQENATQVEVVTSEDEVHNEELNTATSAAINNEPLSTNEMSIVDKAHENIHGGETKIDTNLAGASDLTTYLPADDKNEDDTGYITTSFETTAESSTAELTSSYETEVTTVDNKFTTDSEERPSFRDEESKDTTGASVMEYELSKETTTASLESETENGFTKTSLKTESGVNVKDVNQWESKVTSGTGLLEKQTEPNITKTTAGTAIWTKLSTLSPSQANSSKVINKSAASSTRRPATVISIISTTEKTTAPAEILKVSGLNQEKVKDTKNKAQPEELQHPQTYNTVDLEPAPHENLGLEVTSVALEDDVRRFAELCNELAFRLWASVTAKGLTMSRSVIMSPFAVTSLLAMVFLGARGPTSGQMNDILRLDDMVTFNPHQVFKNVTDSLTLSRSQGIATAAIVRELYSDKTKGKLLDFYKERAQQFYDGHVEEVNFSGIGDLVRRRTNLLIKRQTRGNIPEYLRASNILLRPPLAVFSANIFQTDCSQASTYGRDGEMYFTVMPALRQRRLVPVPAVVWFKGFLAGYEPILDATAASIGSDNSLVSVVMVLPGQQGQQAPGDGLQRLEQRLIETSYRHGAWSRLLRSLLPRPGLELQIPRFSHRSLLNVTSPLQRMGLKDLFSAERADLRGINGLANDLHLSDIIQVNTFSTCAEESVGSRHHVEVYPTSPQRSGREELDEDPKNISKNFDDVDDLGLSSLPLAVRPRQARLPDTPRLRFDRPFLYFVRHNPTGLILYVGRFNPRLLH